MPLLGQMEPRADLRSGHSNLHHPLPSVHRPLWDRNRPLSNRNHALSSGNHALSNLQCSRSGGNQPLSGDNHARSSDNLLRATDNTPRIPDYLPRWHGNTPRSAGNTLRFSVNRSRSTLNSRRIGLNWLRKGLQPKGWAKPSNARRRCTPMRRAVGPVHSFFRYPADALGWYAFGPSALQCIPTPRNRGFQVQRPRGAARLDREDDRHVRLELAGLQKDRRRCADRFEIFEGAFDRGVHLLVPRGSRERDLLNTSRRTDFDVHARRELLPTPFADERLVEIPRHTKTLSDRGVIRLPLGRDRRAVGCSRAPASLLRRASIRSLCICAVASRRGGRRGRSRRSGC